MCINETRSLEEVLRIWNFLSGKASPREAARGGLAVRVLGMNLDGSLT